MPGLARRAPPTPCPQRTIESEAGGVEAAGEVREAAGSAAEAVGAAVGSEESAPGPGPECSRPRIGRLDPRLRRRRRRRRRAPAGIRARGRLPRLDPPAAALGAAREREEALALRDLGHRPREEDADAAGADADR